MGYCLKKIVFFFFVLTNSAFAVIPAHPYRDILHSGVLCINPMYLECSEWGLVPRCCLLLVHEPVRHSAPDPTAVLGFFIMDRISMCSESSEISDLIDNGTSSESILVAHLDKSCSSVWNKVRQLLHPLLLPTVVGAGPWDLVHKHRVGPDMRADHTYA